MSWHGSVRSSGWTSEKGRGREGASEKRKATFRPPWSRNARASVLDRQRALTPALHTARLLSAHVAGDEHTAHSSQRSLRIRRVRACVRAALFNAQRASCVSTICNPSSKPSRVLFASGQACRRRLLQRYLPPPPTPASFVLRLHLANTLPYIIAASRCSSSLFFRSLPYVSFLLHLSLSLSFPIASPSPGPTLQRLDPRSLYQNPHSLLNQLILSAPPRSLSFGLHSASTRITRTHARTHTHTHVAPNTAACVPPIPTLFTSHASQARGL